MFGARSITITTKLAKIGNSTGVTIPREVLQSVGLQRGDEVTLSVSDGKIAIAKADSGYNRAMKIGRAASRRYRTALAILAR